MNFLPVLSDYLAVSSYKITPEMYYSIPSVVKSNYLYFYLFTSVFSQLMLVNFFPIVPVDSSAARIPFPAVQILLAVSDNSYLYLLFRDIIFVY